MPAEDIIFLRISIEQVTEAVTLLDLYSQDSHFVSRSGHIKSWLMFFVSFLSIPENSGIAPPVVCNRFLPDSVEFITNHSCCLPFDVT